MLNSTLIPGMSNLRPSSAQKPLFAGNIRVSDVSFKAPETITHTQVTTSSKTGKQVKKETERKPMEASFKIQSDHLQSLLPSCPTGKDVRVKLTDKDNKLKLIAEYTVTRSKTTIEREERVVGQKWIEGEKIWYSWVPGHFENITATVPVERTRKVTYNAAPEVDLSSPQKFLAFYKLVSNLEKPTEAAKGLLKYLKKSYKPMTEKLAKDGTARIKGKIDSLTAQLQRLQSKLAGKKTD